MNVDSRSLTPSALACSVVSDGSRVPTGTVTARSAAGRARTPATAAASSSSDTPVPTFDFTTLGLPFLIRKVASRPSTSIGLSSSAMASWRISPSSVGTSRPLSTANPSARPTVLAGISAVTVPALTVTGADCASETRASASAVASSLMLGSTVTTTASTGARGSRKASVMAAAVASRSSARPSVPGRDDALALLDVHARLDGRPVDASGR